MILFEPDINNRTEAATFYKNRRWGFSPFESAVAAVYEAVKKLE